VTRAWAARAGAPPHPVGWGRLAGPLFGNTIATLDVDGRGALVRFEQPRTAASLVERACLRLSDPDPRS
jgi:hypothetical protein